MKIGFIGHSFHKKTKSSDFFIDILSKNNEVIVFTEESLYKDKINSINANNFDLLIFWQVIPDYNSFKNLKCKKIVWIPMYDGAKDINKLEWFFYKNININIISFCEELSKRVELFKFNTLKLKYFPEINILSKIKKEKYNIFIWQRNNNIIWDNIKHKFDLNKINKVFIKDNLDPGQNVSDSKKIIKEDYILLIDGWIEKEKYEQIINEVDLYIAPREYEGIGMSFLEPMAKGIPVIAIDKPTMNEYIVNNKNGFLFKKINSKEKIALDQYDKIVGNLAEDIKKYRNDWKEQLNTIEPFIFDIINTPSKDIEFNLVYKIGCLYFNIKKTALKIKKELK